MSETGCLLTSCVDFEDFGNNNFITFGFPNVEIIRKNNNKKNMMSFSDDVDTSATNLLCLFNFIGKLTREQVFGYYQAMDCLLFPSKLETWGLPLSEAKGFDKPILAANLPYAKETVGNYEKVSFFDVENPNELTLLMSEFVLKTIQYQGNKATFEHQNQLNDWNSVFDFIFKE